jgi:hypothetical protein
MIRNKTHHKIVGEELEKQSKYYKAEIKELEERLKKAENLELILQKLYPLTTFNGCISFTDSGGYMKGELILPDNVLQYVDDLFGGKVIKQEGVRAIKIEKDGTIKTGLTKQKADDGRLYKLVQE